MTAGLALVVVLAIAGLLPVLIQGSTKLNAAVLYLVPDSLYQGDLEWRSPPPLFWSLTLLKLNCPWIGLYQVLLCFDGIWTKEQLAARDEFLPQGINVTWIHIPHFRQMPDHFVLEEDHPMQSGPSAW